MTNSEPNESSLSARSNAGRWLTKMLALAVAVLIVSVSLFLLHRSENNGASGKTSPLVLKLVGDGCNWSSSDGVKISPKDGWYCGANLTITNKSRRVVELNARHQEAISANSDVYYADFFLKELQHERLVRIDSKSTVNMSVYFTLPRHTRPRFLLMRTNNPASQFVIPLKYAK